MIPIWPGISPRKREIRFAVALVVILSLLSLFGWISLAAQRGSTHPNLTHFTDKISPVLKESVGYLAQIDRSDFTIPVIVQVNREFFRHSEEFRGQNPDSRDKNVNALSLIHSYTAQLTASQIETLLASDVVEYVTFDAVIRTTAKPNQTLPPNVFLETIGADQANSLGYTGEGVTVAVFDSGIKPNPDLSRNIRQLWDFTSGEPRSYKAGKQDLFGHGTHVAGIIAGNGNYSDGAIRGVAPTVQLVGVGVIDPTGKGQTSNLIKAIDWVIQNKTFYNFRVANLSLGHPPVESYVRDPLCQAVEKMVAAGIITVVSAGNNGKDAKYSKIWGAINSPGNDPAVITVSPVNTRATATQSDDIATTYGSRGSTYQDGRFKPDLCAPGNSIPSLLSYPSMLLSNYPQLQIYDYKGQYIRLSGASQATAFVSGTVALMLQANPGLTPNTAKMILLVTASKLQQPHILEQGNGMVNALTAVQMAAQLNTATHTLTGPVSPKWLLGGEEIWAGGAVASGNRIAYSSLIDPKGRGMWGNGWLWTKSITSPNSITWADAFFSPTSVVWSDSIVWSDSVVWSDSIVWSDSVIWSDTVIGPHSIFWSDSIIWSDGVLSSDSAIYSDWDVALGDPN